VFPHHPAGGLKHLCPQYLNQCAESPVVIIRKGRPVAALVAVIDTDELERLILAHTPRFRRLLAAAERRIARSGGIKHDDFWAEVEKKSDR
jgi:hypothetical protein